MLVAELHVPELHVAQLHLLHVTVHVLIALPTYPFIADYLCGLPERKPGAGDRPNPNLDLGVGPNPNGDLGVGPNPDLDLGVGPNPN